MDIKLILTDDRDGNQAVVFWCENYSGYCGERDFKIYESHLCKKDFSYEIDSVIDNISSKFHKILPLGTEIDVPPAKLIIKDIKYFSGLELIMYKIVSYYTDRQAEILLDEFTVGKLMRGEYATS